MEELHLDENIRNTALISIFIFVLLSSIIRRNIGCMLKSKQQDDFKDFKYTNILARCKILRSNGNVLHGQAYKSRKEFFNNKDNGVLNFPPPSVNPLEAISRQDPSQVLGMLKTQISFVFLNGGLAYLINLLFSGFLVAKAPFPLTHKFKSMLQRGIDIPLLDVTYVSSLSWYFFIMLSSSGLNATINHLLGDDDPFDPLNNQLNSFMPTDNPASSHMNVMMPGSPGIDLKKQFNEDKDALEIANYSFILDNIENELLQQWGTNLN